MKDLLSIAKDTACHVWGILVKRSNDQLTVIDNDKKDIKLLEDMKLYIYYFLII